MTTKDQKQQIRRWRTDPAAFVREALGAELEPWQARVIAAYRRPGKTDTAIALRPRPSLWRRLLARLGLVAVVLAMVGCGETPEAFQAGQGCRELSCACSIIRAADGATIRDFAFTVDMCHEISADAAWAGTHACAATISAAMPDASCVCSTCGIVRSF